MLALVVATKMLISSSVWLFCDILGDHNDTKEEGKKTEGKFIIVIIVMIIQLLLLEC